ncbi:MAG: hypothetical protein LIP10_03645 [Clostridiales bacterium]|nr:hypothetical protein [Clostridiales bacterium]
MKRKTGTIQKYKTYGIRELTEAVGCLLHDENSMMFKNGDRAVILRKKYEDEDPWNFYNLVGRESGKVYGLLSRTLKDHNVRYTVIQLANGFGKAKYRR